MSSLCRPLPDKRSYIKILNGKKITFMGYPCVIGGYCHTSYILYVRKNRSILNDNIDEYCYTMTTFISELKRNNAYRSKFFRIVNKNFVSYNYVVWIDFDSVECFLDYQGKECALGKW